MKINRRQFHKIFAALGVGGIAVANKSKAQSEESTTPTPRTPNSGSEEDETTEEPLNCNQDIVKTETAITCDPDKCIFWIDGLYVDKSQIRPRANLAFLLKFPQTPEHYIDKVVLADGDKQTLGVRYFEPHDKISTGYLPYLIFNNVDLSRSRRYFLVFQLRDKGETYIYRKTLSTFDLRRTRLDGSEIPAQMRSDLETAHNGIVSSPLQFRTNLSRKSVRQHMVRAQLVELTNDHNFAIQVGFFHEDESASHYNRYFIVTDPVGRILGITKREFNDENQGAVIVSALTENDRNRWGLTKDKVAKINDCPYVMVFVDDVKESLSKTTIWLR